MPEEGTTILEAARKQYGHQHPHPVLFEGRAQHRLLPRVRCGSDRGPKGLMASCMTRLCHRGHGGADQHQTGWRRSASKVLYELILSDHPKGLPVLLRAARAANCRSWERPCRWRWSRFEGQPNPRIL